MMFIKNIWSPLKKHEKFFRKKGLYFGARYFLAVLFIYASADKIIHPAAFAEIISNYQILTDVLINPAAIVLPWLELILGLFLIFGIWEMAAVAWINLLLTIFFAALIFNIARGLDVHCGCFSTADTGTKAPMTWYVIRDGFFLILSFILFYLVFTEKSGRNRLQKRPHRDKRRSCSLQVLMQPLP